MPLQILIVDDDSDLAETMIDYLTLEGMECEYAANGRAGVEFASARPYDVIVLDVAMPKMDGLEACQVLRRAGVETPVLMLTARDSLDDKLAGFNAGTDDYVIKPFEFSEVIARIRSLSKRRSGEARRLESFGITMDLDRRQATRDNRPLNLSPIGWTLLEVLMRASPNVVNRQRLVDAVWGEDPPESDSLKVHLHRLRQDVDSAFDRPLIVTVPGHGVALRDDSNAH